MKNYEKVHQWASAVNVTRAKEELETAVLKYPWLKIGTALEFVQKMETDLPRIVKVMMLQEKQNAIHRKFIAVSGLADEQLVKKVIQTLEANGGH